jgi:hypothetical protein
MAGETRPGYYKDKYGQWQKERRVGPDRRRLRKEIHQRDRRTLSRRKADRVFLEKDHKEMIEDALEEFAEGHGSSS